jgi:hypothetical protein
LKDLYKKNEKEELYRITKSTNQKNKKNKISINNTNELRKSISSQNSNIQDDIKINNINILEDKMNSTSDKKNSDNNINTNIKENTQTNINNNILNNNRFTNSSKSQTLKLKRNSYNSQSSIDIIEESKEEDIIDLFKGKTLTYNVLIKVYDQNKKKLFEKELFLNENTHYVIDLDKIYYDVISTLNVLKIKCKYGLIYKLNDFELKENRGKINLIDYELSGMIKTEDTYHKNINMEITIINENNISEKEALLNPQLHCRNENIYFLIPDLNTINHSNLFKYNKGLEIRFKYMTVIFSDREIYDFTSINFDELIYDGNTEIFFDDNNYIKEQSSMKKLWDINICLKYKGIGQLYEDTPINYSIIMKYLNKRYFTDYIHKNIKEIILVTKLKRLFLTEKESRILYDELTKNNFFSFSIFE